MKKTLNKTILKNCLCASLLFGALLTTTSAKADGLYIVPEVTPMIKFDIAP